MIRLEKVNGLAPLQSTVWGEADCYIQYSFPSQEGDPTAEVDQSLIESSKDMSYIKHFTEVFPNWFLFTLVCFFSPTGVNLKLFRSTTTLCVPDPIFGHTETHVLLAPEGMPVQKLLLSCLSSQGLSSGGGVQFEVWCRFVVINATQQFLRKTKGFLSRQARYICVFYSQANLYLV